MEKEFEEIYDFTNEKIAREKEVIREFKTDIRQSEGLIIGIIVICIIISLITRITIAKYIFVTVAAMMLIFCGFYIFSNERKIIDKQNKFSEFALSELAVRIQDGFIYEKEAEISGTYYRKSGFNRVYKDLRSIGVISGTRNGHNISASNVIVNGQNKELFRGIFTYAELNHSFEEIDLMRVNSQNNKKEKYEIPGTGIFMYSENTTRAQEVITEDIVECMKDFMKDTKIKFEMMVNKEFVFFRFLDSAILTKPIANDKETKEYLYKYFRIIDFTSQMSNLLDNK